MRRTDKLKQKWVLEDGVFFPIPGDTTLHNTPGNGVFEVHSAKSMSGTRIGLRKIAEAFTFNFKLYDLGAEDLFSRVQKTWNSEPFILGNKNLGVIFNGLKGTGKTIAAKVLSNRMGIPVVIISSPDEGLQNFIQSLCFECIVLIDEAEKTFRNDQEVLLKMIDGVYNESRKLYLLTTNKLTIDENLLGRPGRIRYIKQFGNLTAKAVNDYIADNLIDISMTSAVKKAIDRLEISTIDILKSIVEEVNIHGEIDPHGILNVPNASYKIEVVLFSDAESTQLDDIKNFIISKLQRNESVSHWLDQPWTDEDGKKRKNRDLIDEEFEICTYHTSLKSATDNLEIDQSTSYGTILSAPDQHGFFTIKSDYDDDIELGCILTRHCAPSLYRGEI